MDHFNYQNTQLFAEELAVKQLAQQFGTPLYVYSRATIERHIHVFQETLGDQPHEICYAVKANSNLGILNLMAKKNIGFDIVSGGELARVIAAGGDPQKTIFSGVAKSEAEINLAFDSNILCFNVESEAELDRIAKLAAKKNYIANIALRINPNVDAKTHPHIATGLSENKFGIPINKSIKLYQQADAHPHLKVVGIACHIGSQITDVSPFIEAIDQLILLYDQLKSLNITVTHLDIGGGLGVSYHGEKPPSPHEYVSAIKKQLGSRDLKLIFAPGRVLVANAGILVTKVEYLKLTEHKNFAIVDAGMNDLIRPALYDAWQTIIPVTINANLPERIYDVVGPVCETSDFLGKNRQLAIQENDYLAVRGSGAYGFSMSSQYNSRPRAAEVLVDRDQAHLLRKRETISELFADEIIVKE